MKTKFSQIQYSILEKDETGLIPENAIYAFVLYDEGGKPKSVGFKPRMFWEPKEGSDSEERRYYTQLKREVKKINPKRTPEEVARIVNALEAALEK